MNCLIAGGHGMLGHALQFGLKPKKSELNLMYYDSLSSYIERHNIKQIVHAAGKVGGVKANDDFVYDFFHENLQMNLNILKACQEYKIKKSTFFLSTCIFPHEALLPLKESSIHQGEPHPTNFGYAYAKRMLEVGSRSLKKQYQIESSCIVPCNMYGENDNYDIRNGHVIPSLIHKCYLAKKKNENFVIWGSGKAEREFLYVKDVANLLELIHLNDAKCAELMIIAPEKIYTIEEVVSLIIKHMKFFGKVIFDKTKSEGIMRKNTDKTIFRNHFPDFKFTNLDDGLGPTIDYFMKNYGTLRGTSNV